MEIFLHTRKSCASRNFTLNTTPTINNTKPYTMAITRKLPRGSHPADKDNDHHQKGKGRQDRRARNDTEKEGANIAQSGQKKLKVSDEGGTAVKGLDDSADGDDDRHQTTKKATGQQNRSDGNDTEKEGANIALSDQKKLSASDKGGTAMKGLDDSADGDNDRHQTTKKAKGRQNRSAGNDTEQEGANIVLSDQKKLSASDEGGTAVKGLNDSADGMKKAKGRQNRSASNDTEQEGVNIEQSGQKKISASDDGGTAAKGLDVSETDKTSSTKGKSGQKKRSASIDSASPKKKLRGHARKGVTMIMKTLKMLA